VEIITMAEVTTPQTDTPKDAQAIGEDRIRMRAYELYQKRKGEAGDAESDWYQAEAEIAAETTAKAGTPK
jgi:hypothetical protein